MHLMDQISGLLHQAVAASFQMRPPAAVSNQAVLQSHVIAHRGVLSPFVKENTMDAFHFAHKNAATGIEFDIRWTRDLVPVVSHDPTLQRVFGLPLKVDEFTFAELKKRCPELLSLDQVVREFGKKLHFMIELKNTQPINLEKQKAILTESLKSLQSGEDFHFIALSPEPLKNYTTIPREHCMLVAEFQVQKYCDLVLTENWGGLFAHFLLLRQTDLKRLRDHHKSVGTGFIDNESLLCREVNRGMTWLFTNRPDKIAEVKKRYRLKNR